MAVPSARNSEPCNRVNTTHTQRLTGFVSVYYYCVCVTLTRRLSDIILAGQETQLNS